MILKLIAHNNVATLIEASEITVSPSSVAGAYEIAVNRDDNNVVRLVGPPDLREAYAVAYIMEDGKTVDTVHPA